MERYYIVDQTRVIQSLGTKESTNNNKSFLGEKKITNKNKQTIWKLKKKGKTEKPICEHDVQHDVTDESHHHIMRI